MSAPVRTTSQDSADSLRKRVCKACDRCRLKKSKCDGSSPCSRCKADNAICVFGERKKSHDKVYPKGYVEMLEQQQSQLVAGLQETYRLLLSNNLWPGAALSEAEGHPLTHDILARLCIITTKADGGDSDMFEEDCDRLQQRLLSQGAPYMPRRGSISSDSEPSHSFSHKRSRSYADTPIPSPSKPNFRKSFNFARTRTSSPAIQSPVAQSSHMHSSIKPSPLQNGSPSLENIPSYDEDIMLSSWDWQNMGGNHSTHNNHDTTNNNNTNNNNNNNNQHVGNSFFPQQSNNATDSLAPTFDNWTGFESHQLQFDANLMSNFTNLTPGPIANLMNMQEWQNNDNSQTQPQMQQPMDLDFSKFVSVAT